MCSRTLRHFTILSNGSETALADTNVSEMTPSSVPPENMIMVEIDEETKLKLKELQAELKLRRKSSSRNSSPVSCLVVREWY